MHVRIHNVELRLDAHARKTAHGRAQENPKAGASIREFRRHSGYRNIVYSISRACNWLLKFMAQQLGHARTRISILEIFGKQGYSTS